MPTYWPSIPDDVKEWMLKQPVFFTASAPLHGKHINVSPKGNPLRSFAVLGPNQVAYIDMAGSGCETISHCYENGRVTIMFTSFTKFCRILRLFCRGRVIERGDPEFRPFIKRMVEAGMRQELPDRRAVGKIMAGGHETHFDEDEGNGVIGSRAIIVLDVWKVQHSCGFGVPLLATGEEGEEGEAAGADGAATEKREPKARSLDVNNPQSVKFDDNWDDRNVLTYWTIHQMKKGNMDKYRRQWAYSSIDGVPGMKSVIRDCGRNVNMVRLEARARRIFFDEWQAVLAGMLLMCFLTLVYSRVKVHFMISGDVGQAYNNCSLLSESGHTGSSVFEGAFQHHQSSHS